MKIEVLRDVQESAAQRKRQGDQIEDLAQKIAGLVAAENVTIDAAECALRRAVAIVRTRTVVSFTRP